MAFNLMSGLLTQQIAVQEGIVDPQRQNFYLVLGSMLGYSPAGMGAAVILARQEAQQTIVDLPPELTNITPSSVAPGTQGVSVTLAGANFRSGATIHFTDPDISVIPSSVTVASETSITATLNVAQGAKLTPLAVSVTCLNGTTNTLPFAIAMPPTLTSVTPASGSPGQTIAVSLIGTNFQTGATISFTPQVAGLSAQNVVVSGNGTSITATLALPSSAPVGTNLAIAVTGPNGTTNTIPFAIAAATPTLTAMVPASASQGETVNVTLIGTNFQATATIMPSTSDITVDPKTVSVANGTTITAQFVVASKPSTATTNISVTCPNGTTTSIPFNIVDGATPQTHLVHNPGGDAGPHFGKKSAGA